MTTSQTHQQTRILVQAAAKACEDKKGEDTRILELDPIDSGLSDFFLVTSASNDRQAIAIADEIEHRLKKEFGVFPNSVEGRRKGDWILLDYVDFVAHVFLAERRAFYDIERLRKSARPIYPGRVRRRSSRLRSPQRPAPPAPNPASPQRPNPQQKHATAPKLKKLARQSHSAKKAPRPAAKKTVSEEVHREKGLREEVAFSLRSLNQAK